MARPNGIPNPFNPMDPDHQKPKPKASPRPVRVVKMTPAARRRAMSIGVSSTARHRTKKRPR